MANWLDVTTSQQRNKSPGFTDAERKSFSDILASGFVDSFRELHPKEQQYSYYSYRFNARAKGKGWRLDYFVVSQSLMSKVVRFVIYEVLHYGAFL